MSDQTAVADSNMDNAAVAGGSGLDDAPDSWVTLSGAQNPNATAWSDSSAVPGGNMDDGPVPALAGLPGTAGAE